MTPVMILDRNLILYRLQSNDLIKPDNYCCYNNESRFLPMEYLLIKLPDLQPISLHLHQGQEHWLLLQWHQELFDLLPANLKHQHPDKFSIYYPQFYYSLQKDSFQAESQCVANLLTALHDSMA